MRRLLTAVLLFAAAHPALAGQAPQAAPENGGRRAIVAGRFADGAEYDYTRFRIFARTAERRVLAVSGR